jgi:hypothetical protein
VGALARGAHLCLAGQPAPAAGPLERLLTVYQGFFTIALMLIAINRLLK